MRMSKIIFGKNRNQTGDSSGEKHFTLRADWDQDGEESLVNLADVDSADVLRVIHQICFSSLRLLPHVWVFIKKSFQPTKNPKHPPPAAFHLKKTLQRVYLQVSFSLCWALLEERWFQKPLICFRYWLTIWNWEEQAGNAQLKSSSLSVWQNYEHPFFEASDKCQEKLNF